MNEKRYILGVDGGGTKTVCFLADADGRIAGVGRAGCSNHQTGGITAAMENVARCVEEACRRAGVRREEIAFALLGMAGADLPEDFALLREHLARVLAPVPFDVINDTWIAFAAGTRETWGAVSICGTGSNLAVRTPEGKLFTTRALSYMLGNYGGGSHLAEMAMHRAFRCSEGTGEPTLLAWRLPALCGCADMDELALRTYRSDYRYPRDYNISRLVFELAAGGDAVCLRLLAAMGGELGEMLGRLIVTARLADEAVPVVLAGTLHTRDDHALMRAPLVERLHAFAPRAAVTVAQSPPVLGAALHAYAAAGIPLPEEARLRLQAEAGRAFA
mgnify:CR=1 FL=1